MTFGHSSTSSCCCSRTRVSASSPSSRPPSAGSSGCSVRPRSCAMGGGFPVLGRSTEIGICPALNDGSNPDRKWVPRRAGHAWNEHPRAPLRRDLAREQRPPSARGGSLSQGVVVFAVSQQSRTRRPVRAPPAAVSANSTTSPSTGVLVHLAGFEPPHRGPPMTTTWTWPSAPLAWCPAKVMASSQIGRRHASDGTGTLPDRETTPLTTGEGRITWFSIRKRR